MNLTATEIGYLWNTYHAQCMNYCLLKYFDSIVEDEEIKQINSQNLQLCQKYLTELREIFKKDAIPIPIGFSDDDLNETNEPLYTDPFILFYQWFIAKGNLNFGSIAINTIAREDVFLFYNQQISEALTALNDARKLLLNKGLWIRAPYMPTPNAVEFVQKESFLNGWFGDTRPLLGVEIASLFYNQMTNTIGLSVINSFIQVTQTKEIKDYFVKGKEIAAMHIDVFTELLKKEELAIPSTWNSGITTSTEPPFSEKFMLNFIVLLNAQGISNYGIATSMSARRDIGMTFTKSAADVAKYSDEGAQLLIEKGWMEAQPHAPKR
jgi:hypothetical protein